MKLSGEVETTYKQYIGFNAALSTKSKVSLTDLAIYREKDAAEKFFDDDRYLMSTQ